MTLNDRGSLTVLARCGTLPRLGDLFGVKRIPEVLMLAFCQARHASRALAVDLTLKRQQGLGSRLEDPSLVGFKAVLYGIGSSFSSTATSGAALASICPSFVRSDFILFPLWPFFFLVLAPVFLVRAPVPLPKKYQIAIPASPEMGVKYCVRSAAGDPLDDAKTYGYC
jgi:hypothetical protein